MTDDFFDLILTGGLLVTGEGIRRADVGVRGETVAAIAPDLRRHPAREVVDATGMYVLPGAIDVHVHPVYEDDVEACSRVAAYGGITTLLHFAYARPGESLLEQVERMLEDGQARSRLDFSLHGGLFEAPRQVPEIPRVMELGVRTFKFFLAYVKQRWYTDDYHLLWAMHLLAERGGMAMIHAENGGGIDYLEDRYWEELGGSQAAHFFHISHPPALEEEAVFRAISMAEVAHCPLYIVHVTAARVLRPIRQARAEGRQVFAETCAHYLTLTQDLLQTRGALAKIGPPLRTEADQEALWQALADGTLSVVSSDHAPKKKDPWGDFREQPYGAPGLETLFIVTHDEGVNRGRISLVRLVQVLCENPARIFGLYPRKGTIAVGSDADLVIFDPRREVTLRAENLHSGAGYTLYEGRTVLGWPVMSFQRGHRVLWEGEVVAEPGAGRFLPLLASPQVAPL